MAIGNPYHQAVDQQHVLRQIMPQICPQTAAVAENLAVDQPFRSVPTAQTTPPDFIELERQMRETNLNQARSVQSLTHVLGQACRQEILAGPVELPPFLR